MKTQQRGKNLLAKSISDPRFISDAKNMTRFPVGLFFFLFFAARLGHTPYHCADEGPPEWRGSERDLRSRIQTGYIWLMVCICSRIPWIFSFIFVCLCLFGERILGHKVDSIIFMRWDLLRIRVIFNIYRLWIGWHGHWILSRSRWSSKYAQGKGEH